MTLIHSQPTGGLEQIVQESLATPYMTRGDQSNRFISSKWMIPLLLISYTCQCYEPAVPLWPAKVGVVIHNVGVVIYNVPYPFDRFQYSHSGAAVPHN